MMAVLGSVSLISRHRVDTDGSGVVTLVGMYGCPLSCKYCINKGMYDRVKYSISAQDLFRQIQKDELYFIYSNGGVCFGGHEPLLQVAFLKEFIAYKRAVGAAWRVGIETSLNVSKVALQEVIDLFDYWIVDIKDINPAIYESYTSVGNDMVLDNLHMLVGKDVALRIPLIKGYNTQADIVKTKEVLLSYGFELSQLQEFEYLIC